MGISILSIKEESYQIIVSHNLFISFVFSSLIFIHRYFKTTPYFKPLQGLVPSGLVLLAFVLSWIITAASEASLCCNHGWLYRIVHIGIGGICLLAVAGIVYIKEKALVNFLLEHWLGITKSKKE